MGRWIRISAARSWKDATRVSAVAFLTFAVGAGASYAGTGTPCPSFSSDSAPEYDAGDGPFAVALSDLDGDGYGDLAVANRWSGDVSVLLNTGDGTFAAAVAYAVGNAPRSVVIGDMDGDGDDDLAVADNATENVSVLLNAGMWWRSRCRHHRP